MDRRGDGVPIILEESRKNVSQLAGFANKDDLAFFLEEICGVQYVPRARNWHPRRSCWTTTASAAATGARTKRVFLDLLRERPRRRERSQGARCEWLPVVQRGQTPPLPPAARGGVPETALGRTWTSPTWVEKCSTGRHVSTVSKPTDRAKRCPGQPHLTEGRSCVVPRARSRTSRAERLPSAGRRGIAQAHPVT